MQTRLEPVLDMLSHIERVFGIKVANAPTTLSVLLDTVAAGLRDFKLSTDEMHVLEQSVALETKFNEADRRYQTETRRLR